MLKRVILGLALASLAIPATAQVHVKGYVKKDGTYVAPHVRSSPDNSRTNNWTAKPNVNPYTGKAGTSDPYAPKPSTTYGYTPPCYYNCGK